MVRELKRVPSSVYQLFGLAYRAGRLIAGEEAVRAALRSGKAHLVFVSGDASEHTRARFVGSRTAGVAVLVGGNRHDLGSALGKGERVVVALTDPGFVRRILREVELKEAGG